MLGAKPVTLSGLEDCRSLAFFSRLTKKRDCVTNSEQPGVAQACDLAGITNTVGAPFLCVFCEGPALSGAEGAGVGNAGAKWVCSRAHNKIK